MNPEWRGMMAIAPWGVPVQLIPGVPTVDGKWVDIGVKLLLCWLVIGAKGFARAIAIRACGDPTPVLVGRLTAAPQKHHSLLGSWLYPAFLLYLSRGTITLSYGAPVPYNQERMGNRARLLVALSSPLISVLLGLAALGMIAGLVPAIDLLIGDPTFAILQSLSFIGLFHGMLSLFPMPPYDGGEIVRFLLPGKQLKKGWDVIGRLFGLALMLAFYLFLLAYFIPSLGWLHDSVYPALRPILMPLYAWLLYAINGIASLSEQIYWLVREG